MVGITRSKVIFHNIWDVILPIDFHIFLDGHIAPPTRFEFPSELNLHGSFGDLTQQLQPRFFWTPASKPHSVCQFSIHPINQSPSAKAIPPLKKNYFTSCDPHHDIYTFCYWQIFWHSIWHIFWHSIWHSTWHIFWQMFWHIFWHIFWHMFWRIFWHSIWHSIWHIFWHIIWQIFWHSIWHSI